MLQKFESDEVQSKHKGQSMRRIRALFMTSSQQLQVCTIGSSLTNFVQVRDNQDLRQAMLEKFKSEEVQSRKVGAAQQRIMSLFLTRSKEIQVSIPVHMRPELQLNH